ncbi:MAG: ROK family protein [Candidatus Dadabacteria bacterium]
MREKRVIGIDIGGTNLRGALVSGSGNIIKRLSVPSGADLGIDAVIENLGKLIDEIRRGQTIDGVGIGIPGIIDLARGLITQAPNIMHVHNYPFRDVLMEKIEMNIPVFVENDANCAALGELWKGVGEKVDSLVLLAIGTGLGGGIILNRKLWRGADGMAGEVGHMTISPDGAKCNCGNTGCLETFASAVGIRRMVKEGLDDKTVKTSLREEVQNVHKEKLPEIVREAAIEGDKLAILIWEEFGRALGIAVAGLVNLLNVEMVVISGGLSDAWELFIDKAVDEAKKRGLRAPMERVYIKKSTLGGDGGLLGAAYLVIREGKQNPIQL